MANEEHLKILRQGVEVWNRWRQEREDVVPELSFGDLARANLVGANLSGAVLFSANLNRADLRVADLNEARLSGAYLRYADLSLSNLRHADLDVAHLRGAILRTAFLTGTHLIGTELIDADLAGAHFGWTILGALDLSEAKGLDEIAHVAPSTIGADTLEMSSGRIPEVFLRGCGLPDVLIEYQPSLSGEAIKYYSCFISYSSEDDNFAKHLHADLQSNGVRCWFAPEDMKIGDKVLETLDQAVRLRDKVLLILSERALTSDWVEDEVTAAFEEERKRKTTVLFPVRLDDTVMDSTAGWAGKLRGRHIGDFREWKDHDAYQKAFQRLLRDLKVEKGKGPE